jgi:ABC-type microcin C transport system duplicated ATPase subunit YejF
MERKVQTRTLLEDVGLDPAFAQRFAHQLSGGQRQRASIARALASGAQTLILDEPTSALDAHARLQIVELLNRLRDEHALSYLVISHDFQVISRLCTRVMVMLKGEIIEEGRLDHVLGNPQHVYTQNLILASRMQPGGSRTVSSSASIL